MKRLIPLLLFVALGAVVTYSCNKENRSSKFEAKEVLTTDEENITPSVILHSGDTLGLGITADSVRSWGYTVYDESNPISPDGPTPRWTYFGAEKLTGLPLWECGYNRPIFAYSTYTGVIIIWVFTHSNAANCSGPMPTYHPS